MFELNHPFRVLEVRQYAFACSRLIMKLLSLLLMFFVYPSIAAADVNCDDIIGAWSSERHDSTLSSERRTIKALNPDGSYWIKFIHDDGKDVTVQEEHGSWTCSGNTLGIKIDKIDDKSVSFYSTFNLLTANASFHSMKPVDPNCASVLGDCSSEMVLEYYRVLY